MWIMLRIFYVIAILLNSLMILHVVIMREENMVVRIFMLLNYISSCWDCYRLFLLPRICQFLFALICLLIKFLCIGSMLDLDWFVLCFMMLSLCFNPCLSCEHHWNIMPSYKALKKALVGRQPNIFPCCYSINKLSSLCFGCVFCV